jgi:amino acid permease
MNLNERLGRIMYFSLDLKDYMEAFPFVIFVFAGQPLVLSL